MNYYLSSALAIYFTLSPGILGMIIGLKFGATRFPSHLGVQIILCSAGGLAGYFAIAILIWIFTSIGINPFGIWVPIGIALISALTLIFSRKFTLIKILKHQIAEVSKNPVFRPKSLPKFLLGALFLGALAPALLQHQSLPTIGWDTTDFWAFQASRLIEYKFIQVDGDGTGFAHEQRNPEIAWAGWHDYVNRHPITNTAMIAWSGWINYFFGTSSNLYLPWLFCALCIAGIAFGYSYDSSRNYLFSSVIFLVTLTTPLIENHSTLGGYAEIYVGALTITFAAMTALGVKYGCVTLSAIGLVFGMGLVMTKNTGSVYFLSLAIASAMFYVLVKFKHKAVIPITLTLLWFSWKIVTGFEVSLLGNNFSLSWSEIAILEAAGLRMPITLSPILDVLVNEVYSLFLNSSFSVLVITASFALVASLFSTGKFKVNLHAIYLIFLACALFFMLTASQFVLDYAFRHATPGSDTGNSRFSIPFVLLLILVSAHAMDIQSRHRINIVSG